MKELSDQRGEGLYLKRSSNWWSGLKNYYSTAVVQVQGIRYIYPGEGMTGGKERESVNGLRPNEP